jgi:acyl dehydratase
MAYAAGVGDDSPSYYDTNTHPQPVHPLYPVSPEWSLLITEVAADQPWSLADAMRGVHATHDLTLHRSLYVGTEYTLTAAVVSLEQRTPGAYQVIRFEAHDAGGLPLWTSWMGTLFRGLGIEGPGVTLEAAEPVPAGPEESMSTCSTFDVTLTDAHVYGECARIWNPIHTDISVARGAGLDGVILHGTAVLAKAVTRLAERLGIEAPDIRRIACRFASPVRPGDALTVRSGEPRVVGTGTRVAFEVTDGHGRAVLCDGLFGVH